MRIKDGVIVAAIFILALLVAAVMWFGLPQAGFADAAAAGAVTLLVGIVFYNYVAELRMQERVRDLTQGQRAIALTVSEMGHRVKHLADQLAEKDKKQTKTSEARMLQAVVDELAAVRTGNIKPLPEQPPVEGELTIVDNLSDDEVISLLREAVRADRIQVFQQPIVTLPQRKAEFTELLSRIRLDGDRFLAAEKYIDIARREGLIHACDNLLLLRTLQMARDSREHLDDSGLFCNIAGSTMTDELFMMELLAFLSEYPDLAPRVVLELDYDDLSVVSERKETAMDPLVKKGVRFSVGRLPSLEIDYEMLEQLPLKFIKLPAPLLLKIIREEGFSAAMEIKKRLDQKGITPVVEHLETEKEVIELLDLNIVYGQGFLFAKPVSSEPV